MRYFALIAGLVFLFTAQQCKTATPGNNNLAAGKTNYTETMTLLQNTWLHSYEEDKEGARTYRPNSYSFPPSRGRTGFAFEPGGKFIQYDIAPTDGLEPRTGTWKMKDDKTVSITFPAGSDRTNYDLEILSLGKTMLSVRMHER